MIEKYRMSVYVLGLGAEAGVIKQTLLDTYHASLRRAVYVNFCYNTHTMYWQQIDMGNMCTAVGRALSIRCFSKCHLLSLSSQLLAYINH